MRRIPWTTALLLPGIALAQQVTEPSGRLREVRIVTGDVFPATGADQGLLYGLVNALHWTTREDVIARELWFAPGDVVDRALAAELERNLRALNLFADVTVRLVATDTPGAVDLEITTRDRLTLSFGGGASYVGGVAGLNVGIGEANLFGTGDHVGASFRRNSEGEYRGGVVYTDLHLFDTWHTGTVRYDRTDEGNSYALDLSRPFHHLTDPRSYGTGFLHSESEVDYYDGGDSVAAVQDVHTAVNARLSWGSGPRDERRGAGFVLDFDRHDYGDISGPLGPTLRVPGDTWSTFAGVRGTWQSVAGYRKVEGLDTLVYVQDLTLGLDAGAVLGARWRDEAGRGGELQPELRAWTSWASEPIGDVYTKVRAAGSVREDGGKVVGWYGSVAARAFAMVSELHTLCGNVAFDAAEELQDLPAQLTLGEDTGLRGYDVRLFAGTRRLHGNLEHRFDTDVELATVHLGLVAFFDAGWVGADSGLGRPFTAAGAGLRLGSKPLFGGGILRIDFARPFVEVPGQDNGWKLSVSVGQVFGFGD